MGTIRTILHPTDFSEGANNAFGWACSMARENHARLIVLHVMLPIAAPLVESPLPDPAPSAEKQEDLTEVFCWPKQSMREVEVEHQVVEGDVATMILRVAETANCDVIVMGTHGRTGLRRLLTGSVAEEVLRKATCPVVVVKDLPEQTEGEAGQVPGKPGEVIDVQRRKESFRMTSTAVLAQGGELEVVRWLIPARTEIQEKKSAGEVIIHCIGGRIEFTAMGKTQSLAAGQLICLPAHEQYSIKAVENTTLVLTVAKRAANTN